MSSFKVIFEPDGITIILKEPTNVFQAAKEAGILLESICGGKGICGKCRVRIMEGAPEPTESELKLLSLEELETGFRLACQTVIRDSSVIEIPYETRLVHQKILAAGTERPIEIKPDVKKVFLSLPLPSTSDQRSDIDRVIDYLNEGNGNIRVNLDLVRECSARLRKANYKVTAVLVNRDLIGLEEGDTSSHSFGMAFDLGTSTVVGYLMDLNTGKQIGVSAAMNPQVLYGEDIVSRISFALSHRDGLQKLHQSIIGVVNEIIDQTTRDSQIDKNNIYELTVVGNTCMTHLFLGLNPKNLAFAPYVSVLRGGIEVKARELGINVYKNAKVKVLPNIAGFVGADNIGVILATAIDQSEDIKLAIDIGTNGEILLGSRDKLLSCSTAAGPAFEGARIKYGMRATSGAIDRVEIKEDVIIRTIDMTKPRGICGSGLVDAVAQMLKWGVVDYSGRIVNPDENSEVSQSLRRRVVEGEHGNQFILVEGKDTVSGAPIVITQRDIRELQLAKGAIYAGTQILMKELGVKPEDITEILLAGAFGNYVRGESALRIGLIPQVPPNKIKSVGNAAGVGAKLALLSVDLQEHAERISRKVDYIELSNRRDFQEEFAKAMFFPILD